MNSELDYLHQVISVRMLTSMAYVLRIERKGLAFKAGQHLLLARKGNIESREYSVYSAESDGFFEVLVKEVDDGLVSKQLKQLNAGDKVKLEGPLGFFTLESATFANGKFLFIATGTGISPFHSFVKSYPNIDYRLLHGVRYSNEAYDRQDYEASRHILCTTGDQGGNFYGRVTDYLRKNPVPKETHCFLCGNFNMIHEAFEILEQQGVPSTNVHAEVYF